MNKIIFDKETTGLPTHWNAADNDTDCWPRIAELAWIVIDENDNTLFEKRYIIKPHNFLISIRVSNVHVISTEIAHREGVELEKVLNEFLEDLKNTNVLIAHKIDFDYPILNCEFKRLNLESKLNQLSRFCTMKTNEICLFCDLGRDGKKWPKLKEFYKKFKKNRIPQSEYFRLDEKQIEQVNDVMTKGADF